MDHIELRIDGRPVPKARPRLARGGHVYTPEKTTTAEAKVRALYWAESILKYGRVVAFEGDITIEMTFYLPDRRRVDWDNLAKLVCDALNGIAYKDDSQITQAIVRKRLTQDDGYSLISIMGKVEK